MVKLISTFCFLLILSSCISDKEKDFSNNNLNSTLWMQNAAEYKANSIMTYNAALSKLDGFLNDKNHTALLEQKDGFQQLPAAIILDVDETVLDNSPYQAKLVIENRTFSSDSWNEWVGLKKAKAIPGVVKFLNNAQEKGITIFYVTNRRCTALADDPCPQDRQTFENLQSIGINNVTLENVLLRDEKENWGRDKTSRRTFIAESYRVIMLFGDNLGDFVAETADSQQDRDNLIEQNIDQWGNSWFMLANPTYGGWQSVLAEPQVDNLMVY